MCCPKKHFTLLLQLLKYYKHEPNFGSLPTSSEHLIWIEGDDVVTPDVYCDVKVLYWSCLWQTNFDLIKVFSSFKLPARKCN